MKYITSVTGLQFYAYHGLYAEEKLLGGQFMVDITITMKINNPVTSIEDAINYEFLFETAKEEMAIRQDLIETVAQHIFKKLKAVFGNEVDIKVTIYKPNPAGVFKSGVASVTFEN